MWYCYRGSVDYRADKTQSYRLGYAESTDGKQWKRLDALVGIDSIRRRLGLPDDGSTRSSTSMVASSTCCTTATASVKQVSGTLCWKTTTGSIV
jgi:hypothetical protein